MKTGVLPVIALFFWKSLSAHTRVKSYFLKKLCGVIQEQPSSHPPIKQLL